MSLANHLQAQGRLQESEHERQKILRHQPHHAFALHWLGVIARQVGKNPLAVELIQQDETIILYHKVIAAKLKPQSMDKPTIN